MKNLTCKRLSRDASAEEIEFQHKAKMEAKKILREHNSNKYGFTGAVFGNFSRKHPKYVDPIAVI